MWHTFWSCLIRCPNIKGIWLVLWKIQSRYDFVHRRMDRRRETSKPPFQLRWSGRYNHWFFSPCDLEIWWMTLKNNWAPLLCHLSYAYAPLSIIQLQYVNSNWSYSPETAKLGFDLCDLNLWPLTLTSCMDITFVNVSNSWKFHDDIRWQEHGEKGVTDRQTDRETERGVLRAAWSQLKQTKHSDINTLEMGRNPQLHTNPQPPTPDNIKYAFPQSTIFVNSASV